MWGWKPPRKEWEERSGLVLTERSPLPGAAAEASTPTVGVGASTLSRTGLALIGVVRCVGLSKVFEEQGIHRGGPCGEGQQKAVCSQKGLATRH